MAQQELNIGIIGGGGIVRDRHMPGLAKIEGVKVAAVCNRRRESAEAFAKQYDVPRVVDDWNDLLAMDDLDIILIGTQPYMHRRIANAALRAGKHVFCQARMCMDLAEAREMAASARARPDQVVEICFGPVGMPNDWVVRRMLHEEKYVGDIRHVLLREFSDFAADPAAPMHWRMDERLSGINTLSCGIWVEVLNRWVGEATRLSAQTKIHTPRRKDPATGEMHTIKIPDEAAVVGDLACGGTFNYQWSGVTAGPPQAVVEIVGTEGQIVYDTIADRLLAAKAGDAKLTELTVPPDQRRQWTVEADFIDAVRTGNRTRIEPDFDEGVRYMAFLQAIWHAAETGQRVAVPTDDTEVRPA